MIRWIILGVLFLAGCTSLERSPSSLPSETLKQKVQSVLEDVSSPDFTDARCVPYLKDLSDKMKNLNWDAYSNQELRSDGTATLDLLWKIRSTLHAKLGQVSSECAYAMRDTFHVLRDTEDYLGEFAYNQPALNPADVKFQDQPVPIYDSKAYPPYFVADSLKDQKFHFQSGDLMIARGISFISAIISQVSDNHSQFSHVVFVNVDPKTKKENTIESYIGVGVATYDINFALKNENARLLVLRPKVKALGERAAAIMMQKTKAGDGHGHPIGYDYGMDFKDHSKMSCAEVATASYEWASGGKVILPTYPARISLDNQDFLSKMTLKQGPIFTPDDLEIDPQFDLILDWRDYRLTRDSRYKDAILSEMMRWVGDLHYKFHDTAKSFLAKNVVLPSRTTPLWGLVKKITGSPDLDPTLPKKALGVMTVLGQIGDKLLAKLEKADQDFIASHQRPMTNLQLRSYLEDFRREDLHDYVEDDYSLFHSALRPDGIYPRPADRDSR